VAGMEAHRGQVAATMQTATALRTISSVGRAVRNKVAELMPNHQSGTSLRASTPATSTARATSGPRRGEAACIPRVSCEDSARTCRL
jgi:hypothetical protein